MLNIDTSGNKIANPLESTDGKLRKKIYYLISSHISGIVVPDNCHRKCNNLFWRSSLKLSVTKRIHSK